MNELITVHKLDAAGQEVWAYTGRVLARGPTWVRLEATFDRAEVIFQGLVLRGGDRMVETFFADRWYNVFAVHDGGTDRVKGWYCNITRPARLGPQDVSAEDLALDLLVYRQGGDQVLDEDEFEALGLPPGDRDAAWAALAELRRLAARRQWPFDEAANESAPA